MTTRILITGANGFIGSSLVERFLREGHNIRCLVHKNTGWLKDLKVQLVNGSVTKKETLSEAVKGVDYVFHMAGVLRAADKQPFYEVNQFGTKNLIESVYENNPGLKKFVYISSQAAMGPSDTCGPKDVLSRCTPVSEYGKSKLSGECEALKFQDKLPVLILRPAAVYGPRDRDLFPFFQMASKGIFPLLAGSESLVQLLFVTDLVEFCNLVLGKKQLKKHVYFLAETVAYSWRQVADVIGDVAGKKPLIIKIPFWLSKTIASVSENIMKLRGKAPALNTDKIKEFCQKYWIADSASTEQEFGYKFTKLENGARITYNWYKENNWL